jgi:hypothetical protein
MKNFGIPPRTDAARREEATPVNWRRGLLRLWFLLSAAWVMAWTIYILLDGLQGGFKSYRQLLVVPILLFGPPIALLLFGIAAGWAFRGFHVDKPPLGQ